MFFDSLAHPLNFGIWNYGKSCLGNHHASFEKLSNSLKLNNSRGCLACGYPPYDELYSHKLFFQNCERFGFMPCAFLSRQKGGSLIKDFNSAYDIGYKIFKFHYPSSNQEFNGENIFRILSTIESINGIAIFCTYPIAQLNNQYYNCLGDISQIHVQFPSLKIILAHGGVTNLLEYSMLSRHSKNILLDLSFTMMKYKNSSLDFDLKFLFKNLDQRICIGSDWPEYSHESVNRRFIEIAEGLSTDKIENIAFKNIERFLKKVYE